MRYLAFLLLACAIVAAPYDRSASVAAPKATAAPKASPAHKAAPLSKAQKAKLEQLKTSAPADEYFGRMKLSYLGINNTFRDQAVRAGDHTTDDDIQGKVRFAEESLGVWRHKYPRDQQLPRSLFLASRADLKIWVASFQQLAARHMIELRDKYAKTFFGKQAQAELHKGMTMNFYAVAQACPASPKAPPTALEATPAPTQAPAPIPTEDAKNNVKVNMIPVPCFTPAPSPSPTLAPTPSASGKASPSPTGTASPSASPSPTHTASPSPAPSPTHTVSPSPAPSSSGTPAPTPTVSPLATPSRA
jgi:hypothetical protein